MADKKKTTGVIRLCHRCKATGRVRIRTPEELRLYSISPLPKTMLRYCPECDGRGYFVVNEFERRCFLEGRV